MFILNTASPWIIPEKFTAPQHTRSFCRCFTRQNPSPVLRRRYFSFLETSRGEAPPSCCARPFRCLKKPLGLSLLRYACKRKPYLENFISRPSVIPTFCQRRCINRGRNCVRSKRGPPYMSSTASTYFCALTIRKHLSKVDFERSGRGQESSRGHKFSILENSCPFGTASCWGVPAPNPARNEYSKLELIYFVCKSSRKKIPSVRLTNISLSLIT